jgi:hypothetical protein
MGRFLGKADNSAKNDGIREKKTVYNEEFILFT